MTNITERNRIIKRWENEDFEEAKFYTDRLDKSNIVLGYGYDLNEQSYDQIIADFTAAGILGNPDNQENEDDFRGAIWDFKCKASWATATVTRDFLNGCLNVTVPWSKSLADALFDVTVPRYERMVVDFFTDAARLSRNPKLGTSSLFSEAIFYGSALNSALVSMAYNGGLNLFFEGYDKNGVYKETSFFKAIEDNNRAEAWYQLRYQSNGNNFEGLASRRVEESNLLGLFSPGAMTDAQMDQESRNAYVMYQAHKTQIKSYEETSWPSAFPAAEKIGSQLSPAVEFFNAKHVRPEGVPDYAWDRIIVASSAGAVLGANGRFLKTTQVSGGSTTVGHLVIGATDVDNRLNGSQGNDVLVGGDGNDHLYGAMGDDVLHGGAGDDILDGFWGNDVLVGGDGNDNSEFKLAA